MDLCVSIEQTTGGNLFFLSLSLSSIERWNSIEIIVLKLKLDFRSIFVRQIKRNGEKFLNPYAYDATKTIF